MDDETYNNDDLSEMSFLDERDLRNILDFSMSPITNYREGENYVCI